MAETPYKGYALYEPDASPDLTESGEYNSALMAVDADMHDEEQARIEGDTALNIAIANETAQRKAADDALNGRVDTETAERKAADTALDTAYKAADAALDTAYKAADAALDAKFTGALNSVTRGLTSVGNGLTAEQKARADADTALGKRIDNAEAEISANSADLTGIKGLTYGEQHVNFIENSNGEYSSPALDEIAEQINQGFAVLEIAISTTSIGADALARLKASWPKIMVLLTDARAPLPDPQELGTDGPGAASINEVMLPDSYLGGAYMFVSTWAADNPSDHAQYQPSLAITDTGEGKVAIEQRPVPDPYWPRVKNKPFSTIGTGLKVVDDALTVDTQALPSALTIMQLSEFGELTDNTGATHSAIGDGNAAAYAKLKQAWPSVIVVEGGTSWRCGMYTPSNVEQAGYILVKSANITDSAIQMRIHGGGFSGAITLEEIGG